jgi:hypothetical protein
VLRRAHRSLGRQERLLQQVQRRGGGAAPCPRLLKGIGQETPILAAGSRGAVVHVGAIDRQRDDGLPDRPGERGDRRDGDTLPPRPAQAMEPLRQPSHSGRQRGLQYQALSLPHQVGKGERLPNDAPVVGLE